MSLKAEIETWATALELYDQQNFDDALAAFEDIADSSKILFNIGLIYATLGEHEVAIENFRTATSLDQYLAVAYFQCGVSNFLLGMYEEAVKDFEDALMYLRGNLTIDYSQLGLKFRLYSCEILFNKGLSLIYQGAEAEGMIDLQEARKEKQTAEHSVIDDAIADRAEGYTVFSIPVGVLYRPAMSKVKNLASKNYLGQAKLVAATDASETFVGFTGSARAAAKTTTTGPVMSTPIEQAPMPPAPGMLRRGTVATAGSGMGDGPLGPAGMLRRGTSAAITPMMPSSSSGDSPTVGIIRRGTTAARIESTAARPAPVPTNNDLRRRPSEAGSTARLNRSATASSGSKPTSRLAPMAEQREPEKSPRYGSRTRGSLGTESYEDYEDNEPAVPSRSGGPSEDRTTNWARNLSTSGSSSGRNRDPPAVRRPPPANSPYDDPPSDAEYPETVMSGGYAEMTKIRVKLHYGSDTRGMAVSTAMEFEDFLGKVTKKFSLRAGRVAMKYKDEEGSMVSIMDDDDWESAVETARSYAKGRAEGKVEIWVEDAGFL
ncbi:hypothetical protein PGT21_028282 [Puccinia graminis f. sp. tritici]|uniref:PB1 domain-containing protein n=1 Tax=Puccinia graminis f. sp. tritici TaxID=56615 RepID=A0A5B0N7I4_PUCGR|nr:hypothetical protein PGT21_028282 [Puccinia graminis f. sp. tritici]KAA1132997.1 hypothetical protein PGTUg99_020051 [Puccinia graminis f. sp. tritici]